MRKRMGESPNFAYNRLGLFNSRLDLQLNFLGHAWGCHKEGYGHLFAIQKSTHLVSDLPIWLPTHAKWAAKFLRAHSAKQWDIYFCPVVYSEACRRKEYAKFTNLAWADVDEADPDLFVPEPSILWQTSPGRTQALWVWDKLYSPLRAEHYSRALTYRHGADKGGWSCTKLLRLPGTYNHKPIYKRPEVKLLKCNWSRLRERPSLDGIQVPVWGTSEISIEFKTAPQEHRALLKQFRRDLHPRVRALLSNKKAYEQDRSKAIYEMIADLHRVGAKPNEIATLVGQSAYFVSKHGINTNKLASEIVRVISKQGRHHE